MIDRNGSHHDMPRNQDAERAVIGACVLDQRLIDEAVLVLRPEMFWEVGCQIVFQAMIELNNANKGADDAILMINYLKKKKQLDEVGGADFINKLMGAPQWTANWKYYAELVRGDWLRREAIKAGMDVAAAVRDPSITPEEAINAADRRIVELVESIDSGTSVQGIDNVLLDAVAAWERGESAAKGLPGHIQQLTDVIGGFGPGNLVIVAARPSVGKTAFALNQIRCWCRDGQAVLLMSIEQSKIEIAERLLSMETNCSIHDMANGKLDSLQAASAQNDMAAWPLTIDDRGDPTIPQVESICRLYHRKKNLSAIVIDYLQLIQPSDKKIPREQQVADISRRLKALAKSLQVPIVVLAQLNRQSETRENRRPKISDLRESGSIEQDADKIILLWRPHQDDPTHVDYAEAVAIVGKNRNGPTGDVRMVFREHCFQFTEAAPAYQRQW